MGAPTGDRGEGLMPDVFVLVLKYIYCLYQNVVSRPVCCQVKLFRSVLGNNVRYLWPSDRLRTNIANMSQARPRTKTSAAF